MQNPATHLYYHPLSLQHDTGSGHPERSDRIQALLDHLEKTGLNSQCIWKTPEPATLEAIQTNHSLDYIKMVQQVAAGGGGPLDADTILSSKSYEAALMSSGACIQGVDTVCKGNAPNAFCMNRPPGHHSRRSTAMGFCLFNNIAIGARHALKQHGLERVFILDWDVHHGNGTQESFYEDESVFYCSIHQSPLYPGTGMPYETGDGEGEGFTLNLTVSSGTRGNIYESLLNEKVLPAMRDFQPELIMISAGFDAHRRDPLAGVQLEDEDFGMLTSGVLDAANDICEGRVVSVLEGGYDLEGLAGGVEQHLRGLLGLL
ncbi:MAG: histone deacetylase [Verrucomicrobia bacterium]|nr:histone deacetylase [Verrucomicrobiota bacterium]